MTDSVAVDGVAVNPRAMAPLLVLMIGYAVLLGSLLLVSNTVLSMAMVLIGGALVCAGSLFIPPTPAVLPIANAISALFLFLQIIGFCSFHCGGFTDYQVMLGLPTALVGIVSHGFLVVIGALRPRWPIITANVYRILLGLVHGASLFFGIILLVNLHWCPSCASVHVIMIAQGIVLIRITSGLDDRKRLRGNVWIYAASILIGALLVNAAFHHRNEKKSMEVTDALIGYLERARTNGETIGVPYIEGKGPAASPRLDSADHGHMSVESPVAQRDDQARRTLGDTTGMRIDGYDRWGNSLAPITIRAHMSPTCPGCREHWPHMTQDQGSPGGIPTLRDRVEAGEVQVHFMFTWPVVPRTHYGASLATSVLYACGMLGEEELLLAGDRFFSPDGVTVMDQVDAVLADEASRGPIAIDTEREALAKLIQFLTGTIDVSRITTAYVAYHGRFDDLVKSNVSWLFDIGKKDTPRFFYVRTDGPLARPYLDSTSLDPQVVGAFLERGLNPIPPERK